MQRANIKKWFEIVTACSGSGSLIQMRQALAEAGVAVASQYVDNPEYADQAKAWKPADDSTYYESFADDFDQLYRPEIISMVNWCILSDVAAFYQLFDSFKADIVDAFNSSDGPSNKQRLADWLAQQLYIIKTAANRLAATLKEKWNIHNDPCQGLTVLSQRDSNSGSFVLLIATIQNQVRQQQLADQQPATNGLINLDRYKKPDQDYFYLALLLAQKTEDYLTDGGWLDQYCTEPAFDANSPLNLLTVSNKEKSISLIDTTLEEQSDTSSDDKMRSFESFKELFIDPEYLPIAIDALYKIRPKNPVITHDTKTWRNVRGSKAILAAWLSRLDATNRIHFVRDKKNIIPLLEKFFPELSLGKDGRSLRDIDEGLFRKFSALILPILTA